MVAAWVTNGNLRGEVGGGGGVDSDGTLNYSSWKKKEKRKWRKSRLKKKEEDDDEEEAEGGGTGMTKATREHTMKDTPMIKHSVNAAYFSFTDL